MTALEVWSKLNRHVGTQAGYANRKVHIFIFMLHTDMCVLFVTPEFNPLFQKGSTADGPEVPGRSKFPDTRPCMQAINQALLSGSFTFLVSSFFSFFKQKCPNIRFNRSHAYSKGSAVRLSTHSMVKLGRLEAVLGQSLSCMRS